MYRSLLITFIACIILVTTANSQNWVKLRDIPVGLSFPVVVELNKEIHVIGGGATGGATDIHLRYKPTTDTWDTLAPVPYKAQQPSGVVLNGKIHYFGGGYPNSGKPLSSHYAYDPASNTWTQAAALPIARVIMRSASINGKVYALGGQPDKTRMDEYDPQSNMWTTKKILPDNSFWYSSITVIDNVMYRFGGGGYTAAVNSIHKYDSDKDTWIDVAALPIPLHAPASSALRGMAYISGGYYNGVVSDVQTYNPVTNTIKAVKKLPIGRNYHEMVTIDSCIYSVGGDNASNTSLLKLCISSTVSVEDELVPTVAIFPQPANDVINVHTTTHLPFTVDIYNIAGVKKMHVSNSDNKAVTSIDIQHLPEGMYIYRMYQSDTNAPIVGKIIIVR